MEETGKLEGPENHEEMSNWGEASRDTARGREGQGALRLAPGVKYCVRHLIQLEE